MNTTTHPVAPEEIMAFLDGELSAARAQSVSAHIDECVNCREVAKSLQATSQMITEGWTVGAPQYLDEGFIVTSAASMASGERTSGKLIRLRDALSRRWVWAPALSFAVLLIAFLVVLPGTFVRPKAPSQERAVMIVPSSQVQISPPSAKSQKAAGGGGDSGRFMTDGTLQEPSASVDRAQVSERQSAPMIARTVALSIIAKDFDGARASLDKILARHNGYAASLNVSTPQGAARSLQASLRIPAPQLAAALAELKALGHVENETQSGEEVTQQHADLVARLKNSRETEQRLQAILQQRTGKISDVLEVEQEIARVRGEIEQMEAEQKALEHRVDFATIELKLSEEYKAQLNSPTPGASTQLHNASVNGYRNVVDTLLALLLFFAEYGPVLLLWALILFIPAWLVWRRWRRVAAAV